MTYYVSSGTLNSTNSTLTGLQTVQLTSISVHSLLFICPNLYVDDSNKGEDSQIQYAQVLGPEVISVSRQSARM